MTRTTRERFKPYVDNLRKKIAGWSISKYEESPTGVSTGAPPLPVTKATRCNFRNRKDKFTHKQGGWSKAKSKEQNATPPYPELE